MRQISRVLLLATIALLAACTRAPKPTPAAPPPKWELGFWYWQSGSYQPAPTAPAPPTVDTLYVHVASWKPAPFQTERWAIYTHIPTPLPAAKSYWLVFRYDQERVPDPLFLPSLQHAIQEAVATARTSGLNVAGIQLDIDSPTSALRDYAGFLRAIRQTLPKPLQLSITALPDWFRNGTAIDAVLAEVDEFVPQFYDLGGSISDGKPAIAAPFDAKHWAPIFNRFAKPYRIGLSTFGRARFVRRPVPGQPIYFGIGPSISDLRPIDLAASPGIQLRASTNLAGELILDYTIAQPTHLGYTDLEPGDRIQFITPTADQIGTSVASVKQMGGYSSGILFFRWPTQNETLVLTPTEVLQSAGALNPSAPPAPHINALDGDCAAVYCANLYLETSAPFSAQPRHFKIHSSAPLEYVLPSGPTPLRITGPADLDLQLPPYSTRGRLLLGTAVARSRATFTVTEVQP